jgi:hypothetical protein
MPYIQASANCNFNYIEGLSGYEGKAENAMKIVLSQPNDSYSQYNYTTDRYEVPGKTPTYRDPNCGLYLFAQGSEHSAKTKPYAPDFKKFIEENGLGTVSEHPAANPRHNNKIGILFVWVIDHAACKKWFQKNVLDPYNKAQEKKKQKAEVEKDANSKARGR